MGLSDSQYELLHYLVKEESAENKMVSVEDVHQGTLKSMERENYIVTNPLRTEGYITRRGKVAYVDEKRQRGILSSVDGETVSPREKVKPFIEEAKPEDKNPPWHKKLAPMKKPDWEAAPDNGDSMVLVPQEDDVNDTPSPELAPCVDICSECAYREVVHLIAGTYPGVARLVELELDKKRIEEDKKRIVQELGLK